MQRMTGRPPPNDQNRLSRAVVWVGVAAGFGVSVCFLVVAGWSYFHHDRPMSVVMAVALAVISAALATVRGLGQSKSD